MTLVTSELGFNKLVRLEDFTNPELIEAIRDVCAHKIDGFGPQFPAGAEHRKDWEVAMAIRALRHFGALHSEARILGVAAGYEDTIFYLTRHAKEVVAVDLYMIPGVWQPVAPLSMLIEPEIIAPFEFDADRLVVRHMDGRWLRFPADSFDGIFSSGSIEHFGTFHDVANAAYEMGRVLKPDGVLTLSTEFRLDGPLGGIGWPGNMLLFSRENLQKYIVDASGLEFVDELDTAMSEETSSTRVG
ncbi:MAG: class I SAM-dependent methyltransferase, partial [Actinomycetota bacterium]|nr:class I SAM-dependent methyltransferase [Actinomycetota bacterium]